MEELKGLTLGGGGAPRLRPITFTRAKQLVPVANKPVLFYGIEAMAQAGIEEVGIIIAPETGGEIRDAAGDGSQFGVRITYIEQDAPRGLAHAVLTAEPFLGDSPFVMYLGDNLLRDGIVDLVRQFQTEEPDALILLTPVPDPQNYGVAELEERRVARLVEKPERPQSDLALVGVYMFTSAIFEDVGDSVEGELIDSRVEGRVVLEPGAVLERSTVRGPAVIGRGARITDAYIGPYTAIGEDVTIDNAELEYSIVLAGSSVRDLPARIEASLIGRNVSIGRIPELPRAYRFVVGDNA